MLSENTLFSIFFRIENIKQFFDYQICFLIFFSITQKTIIENHCQHIF